MRRVLVIDDEAGLREVMAEVLEEEGFTVEVAADGEQALERLLGGEVQVDVIVTDDEMPRLSGREMLRRLRAAGLGVPAVVASGSARFTPAELSELGILCVLHKPVPLTALVEAVKTAAGG